MALSLIAEQKNIKSLFLNDEKYIIPNYQRQYSWKYDQCKQLYDDIIHAFEDKDTYFIGNLILAVGEQDDKYEVVDGQQRMVTIWLFLRAISVLFPSMPKIRRMLLLESWEGGDAQTSECKITSNVFEAKDDEQLNDILKFDPDKYAALIDEYNVSGENRFAAEYGQMKANAVAIYKILREYFDRIDDKEKREFFDNFVGKIYLLPIILSDQDFDTARNKALTVFETINNRGMDLQDADIFKARLYEMALKTPTGGEAFIKEWHTLSDACKDLGITIDDVFRYYYHIIRGKEYIITSETRLRDFFQKDIHSPFKTGQYSTVMNSLRSIVEILSRLQTMRDNGDEISKWLQVLDAYTNQYPQYALVAYEFYNQDRNQDELINFTQSMIRYCFRKGSTTSVKYEIYNIIAFIANGKSIDEYVAPYDVKSSLMFPGKLRNGWLLLYYYLSPNHPFIYNYNIDKIIGGGDVVPIDMTNPQAPLLLGMLNSAANGFVIDGPKRRGYYEERMARYHQKGQLHSDDLAASGNLYEILRNHFEKMLDAIDVFMCGEFAIGKE